MGEDKGMSEFIALLGVLVVLALVVHFRRGQLGEDGGIPYEDMIDFNEAVLKGRMAVTLHEDVSMLYEHPDIVCRWSDHPNHGGPKPAVWQRDMRYPVCKACLHEDPYE
jgi:hypothetical protein